MKHRPRIHIVDSESPLSFPAHLLPRCGESVKNADLIFAYTEDSPRVYQIGTCRVCMALGAGHTRRRYEYGVREAEEQIQALSESA